MRANFLLGLLLCGCGGGVSLGSVPGQLGTDGNGNANGADASPGGGAYDITCSMYYQPASSDTEEKFTVRSDASGQKTISFPGYTIDAAYADGTLTISVPELNTVQRYPLARDRRPSMDLVGDHGFTGLVYIGSDVQYICKAGGSSVPGSGLPPIDIACNVELRATPSGALEESTTLEFKGPTEHERAFGDLNIRAKVMEDVFEARSFFIGLWKSPGSPSPYEDSRQLYQFQRLENHLADGTFTGRASLTSNGRELSYSCATR